MDGLTNIITKIQEQNARECDEIIEKAKEQADAILSKAKADAESVSAEIEKKAADKAETIASKAQSTSLLEYKRVILSEKSAIINDIIDEAVNSIENADDEVYFGYVETLVSNNAIVGDGLIRFNARDLARIPQGFDKKLESICKEKGTIKISDDAYDCGGGFVIEYPEMKIDCTFLSLIEDKLEDIRDELSKILFA